MRFREVLTPAYGRDYSSKRAVISDLMADKDFMCNPSGQYVNLSGLRAEDVTEFNVRWKRMTMVGVFKISKEGVVK